MRYNTFKYWEYDTLPEDSHDFLAISQHLDQLGPKLQVLKTEISQEQKYLEGVKAECRAFNASQRKHLDAIATLNACRKKLQDVIASLNEGPSQTLKNEVEGPMLDRSIAFTSEYLGLLGEAEADLQGLLEMYERLSDIRHFKHAMGIRKMLLVLYRVQDGDLKQIPALRKTLESLKGEDEVLNAFCDRVRELYRTEESVRKLSISYLLAAFDKAMDLAIFDAFVPDDVRQRINDLI